MTQVRWPGIGRCVVALLGLLLVATSASAAGPDPEAPPAGVQMSVTPAAAAPGPDETAAPMKVSMDFQDANVKDVLKAFSKETGVNVIAREDIGDRKITLYLEDVSVLDALDQILRAADLLSERQQGSDIYIVRPKPEKAIVSTETRVYHLKFARVSTSRLARTLETLGTMTALEAQQFTQLGQSGQAAGGGGGGGGGRSGGSGKEVGLDRVVRELLTEQGKLAVDERTNSLIVTDVPENFARIEAVLNGLDVKTAQISIEAEVLETSLSKLKDLGIEWGTGSEGSLFTLIPATHTTRAPWSTLFGDKSGVATTIASSTDPTGPGILRASDATAILQALQRDIDTKILARPKVLTLSNESAVIRLTSPQSVNTQSINISQSGNVIDSVERMTTGVVLVVTPEVNDDGFVTMLVEPSVTKAVPSEISTTTLDPKTRSARALVRVRSGETLVLGGLIDHSEQEELRSVPILSGIPFIGDAFKDKEVNNVATELVVFVTPRIQQEFSGTPMAWQGRGVSSVPVREQEQGSSRKELIEETLTRLEHPKL